MTEIDTSEMYTGMCDASDWLVIGEEDAGNGYWADIQVEPGPPRVCSIPLLGLARISGGWLKRWVDENPDKFLDCCGDLVDGHTMGGVLRARARTAHEAGEHVFYQTPAMWIANTIGTDQDALQETGGSAGLWAASQILNNPDALINNRELREYAQNLIDEYRRRRDEG